VLTICVPHRLLEIVPLFLVLLLMFGVTAPTAFAQDRAAPFEDTTGPSASQSGLLSEPSFLTKAINRADSELNQGGEPKDGLYPEFGNMITGSGWISAGPGYRHHLLGDRALLTVSTAVSWKLYKMAQARFELPRLAHDHLSVGSQVIYQDLLQVNYFGLGNDSVQANRSGYRLDETDVIGYASWGSNDANRRRRFLGFHWLPGAIMTEYVSTNGRTFARPPDHWTVGNDWKSPEALFDGSPQSLTADYLLEGATGASGHVYEPYLALTPRPEFVLPAYYNGRNLAESYYLGIRGLSWQNIVVGDPLCSLGKPH